ncbi:MAG: hypothetical protein MPN21_05790 [Thermoanaerobaculia bacterium]|nr:hypothetical protein [Thermoanaerobaculia bacterium]
MSITRHHTGISVRSAGRMGTLLATALLVIGAPPTSTSIALERDSSPPIDTAVFGVG